MAQRLRNEYIGSSDVATVMGVNPWATRSDLYNAKINNIQKEESESMRWGTILEPVILQEFLIRNPIFDEEYMVLTQHYQQHSKYNFIGGTADAIFGSKNGTGNVLAEIKTTNEFSHRKWQEELPINYRYQCQFLMGLNGCISTVVIVLVAGQKLRNYNIRFDKILYEDIISESAKFWNEHILTLTPPEDF